MGSPKGRVCNDWDDDIEQHLVHDTIRWMQVVRPTITARQVLNRLDRDCPDWRRLVVCDSLKAIERVLNTYRKGNTPALDSLERAMSWVNYFVDRKRNAA